MVGLKFLLSINIFILYPQKNLWRCLKAFHGHLMSPVRRPDAVSVQGCCRGKRSHRKCRHVPHSSWWGPRGHKFHVGHDLSGWWKNLCLLVNSLCIQAWPSYYMLLSHKYIHYFLNLRCIISHYVSNTFPFWLVESSLLPPQYSKIAMEHPSFSSMIFRLKTPIYMGFPIATFDYRRVSRVYEILNIYIYIQLVKYPNFIPVLLA